MIIQISNKYRIQTNPETRSFVLYVHQPMTKEGRMPINEWKPRSYWPRLDQALRGLLSQEICSTEGELSLEAALEQYSYIVSRLIRKMEGLFAEVGTDTVEGLHPLGKAE